MDEATGKRKLIADLQSSKKVYSGLVLVFLSLGLVFYQLGWGAKIGIHGLPTEQSLGNSKIRFRNVTSDLGLQFPSTNYKNLASERVDAGVIFNQPAVLAVGDLNGDLFMDIVLLNSTAPYIHVAFFDPSTKRYKQQPEIELRLKDSQKGFNRKRPSAILITDLDGDQKADLLVSYFSGCPLLFRNIAKPDFLPVAEPFAEESCPAASAIAEADINLDGKNDFVFAQYFGGFSNQSQANHKLNNKWMGGLSTLLIRSEKEEFQAHRFPRRTYVNSIGFTYLKDAPSLAIYRGNDYSVDELNVFQNQEIKDLAATRMPYIYHGHAGMNSEFFDVDKDGNIDLYVSNIYAPPFQRRGNVLWMRNSDGNFIDRSDEFGVRRCGFAWAAKFASFDNSGKYQLLVVNGVWENDDAKSSGDGDYWNVRTLRRILPSFIQTDAFVKKEDLYFSGNNRWCLFDFSQKPATNIAAAAGVDLNSPTRSMALIDISNSGRLSFVTADINGQLSIFSNETAEMGNWVGLHLVPYDISLGARVSFESLEPKIVREIFPMNGYGAQSDPRIHLGLGAEKPESVKVRITLANGKSGFFDITTLNSYHVIDVSKLR